MKYKQKDDRRTDVGNSIEKRIDTEQTFVFNDRVSAVEKAKELKTYYYPVYVNGKTNGEYAVPK